MDNSQTEPEDMVSPRLKAVSPQRAALERRVLEGVEIAFSGASWPQCRVLGTYCGLVFFGMGKRRRELAISNVQLALSLNRTQATRIARRSAQNWGMMMAEFMHLPSVDERDIRDYVSLEGEEYLQAALSEGKGVIVLGAHLGNWELLGARVALDYPVAPVVRPLSNASVQTHMSRVRRGVGLNLIDKYGAGRPILRALRRNELVSIIADRYAGRRGLLLPLFGHPTRFETAPAHMALLSGAPIVPLVGARRGPWLRDGRIRGQFFPGFKVEAKTRADREAALVKGTTQVIGSIEELVRAYPDQWSWMLRRWRERDSRGQKPFESQTERLMQ